MRTKNGAHEAWRVLWGGTDRVTASWAPTLGFAVSGDGNSEIEAVHLPLYYSFHNNTFFII